MAANEDDSRTNPDRAHGDTSAEAATLQASIHRRLTGAERFRIALDMSVTARAFALARLRREHPAWSDRELMLELARIAFLPADLPNLPT